MSELRRQFASALLVVLTVAAVFAAVLNFQQQSKFRLPMDGVTWVDRTEGVVALEVVAGGPGDVAGLHPDDRLRAISGLSINKAIEVAQVLVGLKVWTKAQYEIVRSGVEVKVPLIVGEAVSPPSVYYQYGVGVAYLLIGLLVYFRRSTAPKAEHFYVLCLASFVLSSFHYTGKLNNFDRVMYWGNVAAGLFAPTIFLHFCLTFPAPRRRLSTGASVVSLYAVPSLFLLLWFVIANGWLQVAVSSIDLHWLLNRVWLLYLATAYLAGAAVLAASYRRAADPVIRQQLKWLRNGAILGVLPFTLFNVLPYFIGVTPGPRMQLAVLSLPLIPLTWAYAIVRYRLMDVDVIFQQGYVYTLATLTVLGGCYGLFFSIGKFDDLSPTAVIILILIATFLFQPIRNWMQEQLDRYYFYKDQYDHRLTLPEFARELSTENNLDRMLESVADRLLRTLNIEHLAFFITDEDGRFALKLAVDHRGVRRPTPEWNLLDLSFLSTSPDKPYLFFEHTRTMLDVVSRHLPASVRRTIAELDLTYYLPCLVRGRSIAYLGVSRTTKNDFLTRDDIELLLTLTGYVGIAVENARLYQSLERKVEAFERLKEFNENIVESINVGILAAGLDCRVESWNSQMERITGVPRDLAVGRQLPDLFPADLCSRFSEASAEDGVHNIYKYVLKPEDRLPAAGSARELILNLAIAPLVSKENERIGRLIIIDDVTDQADLERRLVQNDKLSSIGLLAAGVAHEVNTPLAVISTYAQMLAKQVSGDERKSSLLEKIAKQTFRASEIVNSLLNFSRTSPTMFVEVDLNRVLRETAALVQHQLSKEQVQVELGLADTLPPLKANANKLQQVFLNLFLNARDAMPGGGTLRIVSFRQENRAVVEVQDTGEGIPAENLARIFDPFFTTKGAKKGTGLGLAVTYGIVQEHGGVIDVRSQVGEGTVFHLEFPLMVRSAAAAVPSPASEVETAPAA